MGQLTILCFFCSNLPCPKKVLVACLLSHDLLIAKLHAYGLDIASLNILKNYFTDRKPSTKLNSFFSSWNYITIPQGSILGPLWFNMFMYMFLIGRTTYFIGYAGNNTPFVVKNDTINIIKVFQQIDKNLINCFEITKWS